MKRFCVEAGIPEVKELEYGMDFREPQYRREVFLRFYEFHLKYRAHAGGVYYVFPFYWKYEMCSMEQKLWFCFINGCSQHALTTIEIFERFPDYATLDLDELSSFFRANYGRFGWDTDRRYHKNSFELHVQNYRQLTEPFKHKQEDYFESVMSGAPDKYGRFDLLWKEVLSKFYGFGRLASFSYIEYLKIAGLRNMDCSNLFLEDRSGSKSHRNGICRVIGRDDYDWHDKLNPAFDGCYTEEDIEDLKEEARQLLSEAYQRTNNHPDVSYFTLETTLCCYKSWHRPNRRYPNVYNDMLAERILKHEKHWKLSRAVEFARAARAVTLPAHLRLEDNPADVGLSPLKQNWYRENGEVIMMDKDWPCFKNGYNDYVNMAQRTL